MKILIIGEQENFEECKLKFGVNNHLENTDSPENSSLTITDYEVIFDFMIDDYPDHLEVYAQVEIPVFLNTVKTSLRELNYIYGLRKGIYGFNGLKTFVNRDVLEVTTLNSPDKELHDLLQKIGIESLQVDDRVGMVTPRVILMIINEAYYTVQEGTASRTDIDQGMKLGTNYPHGPFEWTDMIGVKDIYETLEALYEDTKEERYKICPLLKKEYLQHSS